MHYLTKYISCPPKISLAPPTKFYQFNDGFNLYIFNNINSLSCRALWRTFLATKIYKSFNKGVIKIRIICVNIKQLKFLDPDFLLIQ